MYNIVFYFKASKAELYYGLKYNQVKFKLKELIYKIGFYLKHNHSKIYYNFFLPFKSSLKGVYFKYFEIKSRYIRIKKINEYLLVNEWNLSVKNNGLSNTLISIIVPNYNYEQYLTERLDSIYMQTHKNIEVILLDAHSTDNSRDILLKYKNKYPDITTTIFSEKNGGGVFQQWAKGLAQAKGKYIWIAESDDWCEKDFIEKLIPAFSDQAIMLAFAKSDFIQNGIKINSTEQYLNDIELPWYRSFSISANDLVKTAFSIKNIIPNVSSVIFRNVGKISGEIFSQWHNFKLCGDWLFYIDFIKGGAVHYSTETKNYYRVHEKSTSLKVQGSELYYEEHEKIAIFLEKNYKIPKSSHEKHLNELEKHYVSYCGGDDIKDVSNWFNLNKIYDNKNERRPNILICIFCLDIGGGETFPIFLSNELKRLNYPVTVLDCQLSHSNEKVREMLDPSIPLVRLSNMSELRKIIDTLSIDIVSTHHGSVDEIISHFVDKKDKTPKHVITLHGMYEAIDKNDLQRLLKRVEQSCSSFIYIADKNLPPFIDNNFPNMEIFHKIGNGLPYYTGNKLDRSILGISENAFIACIVSRAIPEKGWIPAIEAVTLARIKTGKDIHLILVGSGEVYDKLLGKVPEYIHLVGFQKNVRDYFATADIGLLPSEFQGESFPLVIIECLYSGKPMVASNLGESKNQLKDEDSNLAGIIFDLRDGKVQIDELADIISDLVMDKELYNKLQSRVFSASKKFYIESIAKEYLKVFDYALKENI